MAADDDTLGGGLGSVADPDGERVQLANATTITQIVTSGTWARFTTCSLPCSSVRHHVPPGFAHGDIRAILAARNDLIVPRLRLAAPR